MKCGSLRGSLIVTAATMVVLGFGAVIELHAQQAAAVSPKLAAKGDWSPATKYDPDDLVTSRGSTWRAKVTNKNRVPGSTKPDTSVY
jgi:hypothetical protein